jgi:hypothetical protein
VAWLLAKGFASDAKHALAIGSVLLEAGAFHHVKHKHGFRNRYYKHSVHCIILCVFEYAVLLLSKLCPKG